MLAAATLHGSAGGFTEASPETLMHLAVELRAIAVCMDALLPDQPQPIAGLPMLPPAFTDEPLPRRRPGRPHSIR